MEYVVTFEQPYRGAPFQVLVNGVATEYTVISRTKRELSTASTSWPFVVANAKTGKRTGFDSRLDARKAAAAWARNAVAKASRAALVSEAKAQGIVPCDSCEEVENEAGEWVPGIVPAVGYITATDLAGTVLDRRALCRDCLNRCDDVTVGTLANGGRV